MLAPDLLDLSRHLESIRRLLAESDERDEGWKSEAWRMIQLLAQDASDDLLAEVETRPATPRTSDPVWAGTTFSGQRSRECLVANTSGDVTTVIDETTGRLVMYFSPGHRETAWSWKPPLHGPAEWTIAAWPAEHEVGFDQGVSVFWSHALNPPATDVRVVVAPTAAHDVTPEESHSDESHSAQQAFAQLKQWLRLSDEEAADIAGIGRTTPYAWQRGTVPRPSTVRQLYELHGLLAAVARRRGERGLHEWLNEPQPGAAQPLAALRAGDLETFQRQSRDEIFGESPRRVGVSVLPEVDVDLAGKAPNVPLTRKRTRRRS